MRAITRRGILAGGVAGLVARRAGAAVPESGRLAFQAFRNGSAIGTHSLAFARRGAELGVTIAVDYVVKFGPIPVYRYALRATETWRGDDLLSVRAETNDDGETAFMRADRVDGRLVVDGSKSGRYTAPAGAIAATHWNRREIDAPMINPQNGDLMVFTVAPRGATTVTLASGVATEALHFALTGPSALDLWYDRAGVWVALRAVARDGSLITYVRA